MLDGDPADHSRESRQNISRRSSASDSLARGHFRPGAAARRHGFVRSRGQSRQDLLAARFELALVEAPECAEMREVFRANVRQIHQHRIIGDPAPGQVELADPRFAPAD